LTLPTNYGQFSRTYPFDCQKTDKILDELYEYLAKKQLKDGSWHNRPHLNAIAALALLASGDSRYQTALEKAMKFFADGTPTIRLYTTATTAGNMVSMAFVWLNTTWRLARNGSYQNCRRSAIGSLRLSSRKRIVTGQGPVAGDIDLPVGLVAMAMVRSV
jgi:hypothetical protein